MSCQVREKKTVGPPGVLIMDGVRMHRQALRALLLDEGYQVHEAGDLSTALHALDQIDLHAALVDLRLLGVHGLTAVREITSCDPDLHVIVLISAPSAQTRNAALKAGASAVAIKGDHPDTILCQLRTAVESYSRIEVSVAVS